MCLTGVDYFSTLGYIPAIAGLVAGAISPIATLLIVLLTLFGALPMYWRVAEESPHGQGSIAMLERLLSFWKGKLFVLVLLGFVATGWLVTITLSAADATAHIVENPLVPETLVDHRVAITLVLLALLGAVFLRGFKEAIGVAVFIVRRTCAQLCRLPPASTNRRIPPKPNDWQRCSYQLLQYVGDISASLVAFPCRARLSGFETGVSLMPLVAGSREKAGPAVFRIRTRDDADHAALIMTSTDDQLRDPVLIPQEEFQGREANGVRRY